MQGSGGASVIIRVRDEQHSLERCLTLLGGQRGLSGGVEVIVVDSGSEDQSVTVAERHHARVASLPAEEFTFGGALNLGAQLARHDVLVSLSAHAFPRDDRWLARLVEALSGADVACACGDVYGPDGARLTGPVVQDAALARRRPEWGFSNAAGAFRAELWRRRPFRADLPGCEDKEWALHWLGPGRRPRSHP
jgi:rhamnosyltransferase